MNRFLVCYSIEGSVFVDSKTDFKEIRTNEGFDRVVILEEVFVRGKNQEKKRTKELLLKHRGKII